MFRSAEAAITKHQTRWLKQQKFIFSQSGGWKLESKVQVLWGFIEDPLVS